MSDYDDFLMRGGPMAVDAGFLLANFDYEGKWRKRPVPPAAVVVPSASAAAMRSSAPSAPARRPVSPAGVAPRPVAQASGLNSAQVRELDALALEGLRHRVDRLKATADADDKKKDVITDEEAVKQMRKALADPSYTESQKAALRQTLKVLGEDVPDEKTAAMMARLFDRNPNRSHVDRQLDAIRRRR
jgi:hypothetical protein